MKYKKLPEILNRLNKEQRLATDTLEGPVLMLAGPGTGKTQTLSARIANILEKTEARPENILCLTYTDAGTVAMRERLLDFIGTDAYRVNVFTFHAFCGKVIQEQADYFGVRGLSPASDLERYNIVKKIIDGFPQGHPLTRETGDLYYESKRLLELFNIMKQEGWTPEHLQERAQEWIDSLPDNPDFLYKRGGKNKDGSTYSKGDINQGKIAEEIRKTEQFAAAAATFHDYQRMLKEEGRYDFSDMILWVIDAFKNSPEILASYHDKFYFTLIDEFQDTAGSQYELLMQLVEYSDMPNLFAVGDDDQSIYRFQGASVENVKRFLNHFGDGLKTITLVENHRSTQNILDVACSFISRNVERMSIDKNLKAVNPAVCNLPKKVEIEAYPTLAQETAGIAHQIIKLHEEGVALSRIAVIYRNHKQADEIIRYLTAKEISVTTKKRADVLKEPLAEKLIDVLHYVAAELRRPHSGEPFLFRMLHEPWSGLSPISIARFASGISKKRVTLRKFVNWREEMKKCEDIDLTPEEKAQFKEARKTIESVIKAAATMPLRDLLHQVATSMGILSWALTGEDQVWNLQCLNTLFDFVRDEGAKQQLDLPMLLNMLDDMIAQGIELPTEKMSDSGDGVNFVTTHGSKGLEFDFVFMIGCTSKAWDAKGRSRTYPIPPTVWRSFEGSEEEEARRLFFVGMTRAKKQLIISLPQRDNNDRQLEQSRFVAELVEGGCEVKQVVVEGEGLVEFGGKVMAAIERKVELFDAAFVDALLQDYRMSVSHLSAYLRCPTAFYFTRLLHAPEPASLAVTFGLAVHKSIDYAFKSMMRKAPREFPSIEAFMEEFRTFMKRYKADFTPVEYKRRMEYAEVILPLFYQHHVGTWSQDAFTEYAIQNVEVDGVPITGTLDRVEMFLGSPVVDLVDDKTGNFEYAKKKLQAPDPEKVQKAEAAGKKPAAEDVLGGDYWRQASFYRLLAEDDKERGWRVGKVRFEFVEPEKGTENFKEETIIPAEGDLQIVREQIATVYGKIKNHEFEEGCGDEDCVWCQFVKKHLQWLNSQEIEDLDQAA